MSKIFVDQVDPKTATTLTLGTSGDTVDIPTGVGLSVTDEVKTNKISPATGTAFALGDSGDTFTVPSGATIVNSGTATGFGGGKVLQFVQNTTTTETDGTFTGTPTLIVDFDVTITPTLSTSKILVTFSCGGMVNGAGTPIGVIIKRDSTTIRQLVRYGYYESTSYWKAIPFFLNYLDSPADTSEHVYSFYVSNDSSTSMEINPNGGDNCGVVTAMEIGA